MDNRGLRAGLWGGACALAVSVAAAPASAFCGFYVSGADGSLYANATMVVMMRSGNQTVLSMQNNYQGPPEDFAMVIPVPVVLQEADVRTLPHEVFERVDALAAPRLVEYWEQDPCFQPPAYTQAEGAAMAVDAVMPSGGDAAGELGVEVEAEFAVAEYDVVILSAQDSSGLDTWLRRENYNIPDGAEGVLRGYVEQGTKFFVAKVDTERVTFRNGQAVLSPLRFHYESEQFSLPIRLGLLNSSGQQDLIVHVLSPNTRYEAANYPNAFIPTNLVVADEVRQNFPSFYEALYRATMEEHPGAVVTEYSWLAGSCDPCPTPSLDPAEVNLLGNDVVQSSPWELVLTRLHYRYGDGLSEDLVFRATDGVIGGTGIPDNQGYVSQEIQREAGASMFQGRYIILNPWEGALSCNEPRRGVWGGPPGNQPAARSATNNALSGQPAAPIGNLASLVAGPVQTLSFQGTAEPVSLPASSGGCASCSASPVEGVLPTLLIIGGGALLFWWRRRS
ncbi:MAG: DUF2330 domain-containing protein [Myxococcota bacterium]